MHWSTYLLEVSKNDGYLVSHPSNWEVQPLDARCGDWLGPAVFFSNVRFEFKAIATPTSCGDQWDFKGLPANAVAVDLDPLVVGPPAPGGSPAPPPTHFPIRFDERLPSPAPAPTTNGGLSFGRWSSRST